MRVNANAPPIVVQVLLHLRVLRVQRLLAIERLRAQLQHLGERQEWLREHGIGASVGRNSILFQSSAFVARASPPLRAMKLVPLVDTARGFAAAYAANSCCSVAPVTDCAHTSAPYSSTPHTPH